MSDVVSAMGKLHFECSLESGFIAEGQKDTDQLLCIRKIAQSLSELSDLWSIYHGHGIDTTDDNRTTPLCLQVPGRVHNRPLQDGHPPCTSASYEALIAWRFVCFDCRPDHVNSSPTSEYIPPVVYFDVKAPKSKHLMDRFGQVDSGEIHIDLVGTSEEAALCLEAILEEVWADTDGQFKDGWQQLYMMPCLKKYFCTLWIEAEAKAYRDEAIRARREDLVNGSLRGDDYW